MNTRFSMALCAAAGTGKKPKKLTISAFKEVAPKRGHLFTLE